MSCVGSLAAFRIGFLLRAGFLISFTNQIHPTLDYCSHMWLKLCLLTCSFSTEFSVGPLRWSTTLVTVCNPWRINLRLFHYSFLIGAILGLAPQLAPVAPVVTYQRWFRTSSTDVIIMYFNFPFPPILRTSEHSHCMHFLSLTVSPLNARLTRQFLAECSLILLSILKIHRMVRKFIPCVIYLRSIQQSYLFAGLTIFSLFLIPCSELEQFKKQTIDHW